MAYLDAHYDFTVNNRTYTEKGKYAFINNDYLVNLIQEEGEQTAEGAPYTLTLFEDNDNDYSYADFWRKVIEVTHTNLMSEIGTVYMMPRRNQEKYTIMNLIKSGGCEVKAIQNPDDVGNGNVSIHPVEQLSRTIGTDLPNTAVSRPNDGTMALVGTGSSYTFRSSASPSFYDATVWPGGGTNNIRLYFTTFARVWVQNGRIKIPDRDAYTVVFINITVSHSDGTLTSQYINNIKIDATLMTTEQAHNRANTDPYVLDGLKIAGYTPHDDDDYYNPYKPGGSIETGGGDGEFDNTTEKVELSELPEIDLTSNGMYHAYRCNTSELDDLADFLWSNLFDIEANFKKLFANPMDQVIGLSCIPIEPDTSGRENIKFGTIDTGISMRKIVNQFKEVDCGSVKIDKYWGNFADYSPYTKVSIFLPFIGFRELDPADVMGKTISLKYRFDVITGACIAFIMVADLGAVYQFNGSGITNMPMAANDFSNAIHNGISIATSVATTVAGAVTGVAPLAATGVINGIGAASNMLTNPVQSVSRSGNIAGSAGLMGHRNAFVVITRPKQAVPNAMASIEGFACSYSATLGSLKGFTACENLHLEDIPCTDMERKEIEQLLVKGVIL